MHSFYSMKKLALSTILLFFLTSCSTEPVKVTNGVVNLKNKYNSISNEISNKNDVINIFGQTLLKEYPDESVWVYTETEKTNNFFGKKKIIINNIMVLEFNARGVLLSKNLIDYKNFKDFDYEKIMTKSFALNENFSKKFFASLRKRFQNKSNTQASK